MNLQEKLQFRLLAKGGSTQVRLGDGVLALRKLRLIQGLRGLRPERSWERKRLYRTKRKCGGRGHFEGNQGLAMV
jgi:hypothetical protein